MEVNLIFDATVYSTDAIKKAAYRSINRFAVNIAKEGNEIKCSLNFKDSATEQQIKSYVDEFKKEVLDQDLRELIKKETEGVRNLILAHTFSKTGLIKDE
jgi:His-Xaa-Ser system protein HxsD